MRRLVLIATIYAALTAGFVGRAARPAEITEGTAERSPATAHEGGASHRLAFGRVLWVPAGQPVPRLRRSGLERWTPAAPEAAPAALLAHASLEARGAR